MAEKTTEALAQELARAERTAAELQAWVDSSEAEAEQLRAQVATLQEDLAKAKAAPPAATPSAADARKLAELQAWADASDAEAEQLRAQVAALQNDLAKAKAAAPTASRASGDAGKLAELQAWADASDFEAEQLREKVARLEASLAQAKSGPGSPAAGTGTSSPSAADARKLAELQAWADASDAEGEQLREQVATLEAELAKSKAAAHPGRSAADERKLAELQAWADASDLEAEQLRAQVAALEVDLEKAKEAADEATTLAATEEKLVQTDERKVAELQQWLDAAEAEAATLRGHLEEAEAVLADAQTAAEQVHELEAANTSLREMNRRFLDQAKAREEQELSRLRSELEEAKQTGAGDKAEELGFLLSNAREAIATLEKERASALDQVHRYGSKDSELARKSKAEHAALAEEKDARIAVLSSSLKQREDELRLVEGRLSAYISSEGKLKTELENLRQRECEAREQLGHVRGERDELTAKGATLEHDLGVTKRKLDEAQAWADRADAQAAELEKKLEAQRVEGALQLAAAKEAAAAAATSTTRAAGSAGPKGAGGTEADDAGLEGYSLGRLRRLEALLETEQQRSAQLQGLVKLADKTVISLRDELERTQARSKDLLKRLGLSDEDLGELLGDLQTTRRELDQLRAELEKGLDEPRPPPPPVDAFDPEPPPAQEDVVSAPLDAMSALTDAQAKVAQQATEALAGEARAREQTLSDLNWLKAELEKVSHVRDELKVRLGAMVQREVKRKASMGALLERLRQSEVATAARLGAVRRLQAAIELAQRNAVKVQTIYFQKQIGSLSRQLDKALGKKAPGPSAPRAPVLPLPSRAGR